MENSELPENQELIFQGLVDQAADMLFVKKIGRDEVILHLQSQGLHTLESEQIVTSLQNQYEEIISERANKDMLYGGLWCLGGTVLTLMDIGFIFWGAIVFGAIQFLRGLFRWY